MDAIVLRGRTVTLRLLSLADATALAMAASESRDQYVYTRVPDGVEAAKRYIETALADHEIGRLGAMFEGVRRGDMPGQDGTVRSSAYYSIMRAEWPAVRKTLEDALGR